MNRVNEIISFGRVDNKLMYPHCNPGLEIVLVEDGRLEWAVEDVSEVLNPGTIFFTLPWQVHGSLSVREPKNLISYALIALEEPYPEPVDQIRMPSPLGFTPQEEHLISEILVSAHRHAWPASELIKTLMPELVIRLSETSEINLSTSRALLKCIILELVNIIRSDQSLHAEVSPALRHIRSFLKSLHSTLDEPWSLDQMADHCGLKRTQFANITKRLTGYPPLNYLSRIRIERACKLLGEENLSITDIAFECGFSSSQYFSETFKKSIRMTPSEYRRLLPQLEAIMKANWEHPEKRSIEDEVERTQRLFGQ